MSANPRHPQDISADLVRLFEAFGPAYRRHSAQTLPRGASEARLRLLAALDENGPQTMSDLRAVVGGTAQNITGLVDGLQADGVVARTRHPKDRRATLVTLTDGAGPQMRQLQTDHRQQVSKLFDTLSIGRQRQLAAILEKLLEALPE